MLCGALDAPELDQAGVRELGDRARGKLKDAAYAILGRQDGRVPFVVVCDGEALARGLKAGDIAGLLKRHLGGGGGGKPALAQGAGQDAEAVPAALAGLDELFAGALKV